MPGERFRDLTGAAVPIVQAPMAGSSGVALAVAALTERFAREAGALLGRTDLT